ncbi:MAG: hypothetical protein KGL11_01810 [Alphaproteobacteria bacterium]|nr:hypothetical protein [Alphaproteobacteria bacterium]
MLAAAGPALAAAPLNLIFTTHAMFFSSETRQATPLDPQVFVRDAAAPAAAGPQGIRHVAGFRPAPMSDPPATPVFTAQGKPLGFSLGAWLGATGTATITPLASGKARVTARFKGLRRHGRYSLFENHFDQQPVGFTPLDGRGTKNSFVADANGAATITVIAPQALTDANAVLLVYHSDHATHGLSRGDPGVTAHHQLIAKVP